jgi:hypothetical protein
MLRVGSGGVIDPLPSVKFIDDLLLCSTLNLSLSENAKMLGPDLELVSVKAYWIQGQGRNGIL